MRSGFKTWRSSVDFPPSRPAVVRILVLRVADAHARLAMFSRVTYQGGEWWQMFAPIQLERASWEDSTLSSSCRSAGQVLSSAVPRLKWQQGCVGVCADEPDSNQSDSSSQFIWVASSWSWSVCMLLAIFQILFTRFASSLFLLQETGMKNTTLRLCLSVLFKCGKSLS